MTKKNDDYKITTLEGMEAVRKLTGMYLGDVETGQALMHALVEVIDNSIDEYLGGFADQIIITLHKDGSVSVFDNGRGIPTYWLPDQKMSALESVLTKLHSGGKFANTEGESTGGYKMSMGLHGVGVACTNATAARFRVYVYKDGKEYTMAFAKGKKIEDLSERKIKSAKTGTLIRFAPDPTIFKNIIRFDPKVIKTRLQQLSYLCKGLTIELIDEIKKEKELYSGDEGIIDFVKFLANDKLISDPISLTDTKDDIIVDIALQWLNDGSDAEISHYFTNNIPNPDGGSHTAGFTTGLTRTINTYINDSDLPKGLKISLSGDDVREGLVSVVSIRHPNPRFSSQTKEKLVSEDARTAVENTVSVFLTNYLEQNPTVAKKIITQCVNAHKAREAARKAREAVRKSTLNSNIVLPGTLADCSSKDPDECELFLVEGQSAGGSCKAGRDRHFQAVLPLRGKVLNIEKCEYKKMLDNKELTNLVAAMGTGMGKSFSLDNLRYGKICINTDADVDGSHIRTLLLTFFFRQMPQLIEAGNLYIAVPPLYRVDIRNVAHYIKDDKELGVFVKERNLDRNRLKVQRFKGLGEMSAEQLWETTLNPETRQLLQVKIENYVEADRIFSMLMGNQIDVRRDFIIEKAEFVQADI